MFAIRRFPSEVGRLTDSRQAICMIPRRVAGRIHLQPLQ